MNQTHYLWLLGGGIGSGKSGVRKLLADHGLSTIDADSIGHSILEPDGACYSEVVARWPSVVEEGRIDRSALASIVFSDPAQLSELEETTHPHILSAIATQVEELEGVVVVEIPLLRKAPPGKWRRIVVDCDDTIRLERLVGRGMALDDARARMASQPSRAEWLAVADVVVPNHGDLADLERAVESLMEVLDEP